MSKSNTFESDYLKLLFQNIGAANIGDATGLLPSGVAGTVYVRLYTSAVAVNDSTIGTETTYGGYVAKGVSVVRSVSGWTVSGNTASNAAVVTFAQCTSGSEILRYFAIWKNNTTALEADRLYWGQLSIDKTISTNDTPEFAIGALIINED